MSYLCMKKMFAFNRKEYPDKQFFCSHGDALYIYMSHNPTHETDEQADMIGKPEDSIDRCINILTIFKLWRDEKSGRVHMRVLTQSDGKIEFVPSFILNIGGKKAIQDWTNKLN